MRISDWSSDVCSSDLVDHAAHEAQVVGQQLLGRVHDEDALDVQLQALALLAPAHHQVERRLGRQVQQGGEALAALDAGVGPGRGVVEVVRSEERRVGKEWVSTCSSRWSPDN